MPCSVFRVPDGAFYCFCFAYLLYCKYRLCQAEYEERRSCIMANDVILRTFPRNELEALAMLYIQNQDLSDLSPEELLDKYQDAYAKICAHQKKKRQEVPQY